MRPIFSRLPRVEFCTEAPLVEHAGIDAHEGQRAIGVVDDLERQRRERLVVRALALADGFAVRVHRLDGGHVGGSRQVIDHGVQHLLHALVLVRGTAQHDGECRIQRALAQALAQTSARRDGAVRQKGFHRLIVLLEAGIHQFSAVLADRVENGAVARAR
jgi:hypothetical protein